MPEPTPPTTDNVVDSDTDPEPEVERTELESEQAAQIAALEDLVDDLRRQRDAWRDHTATDPEAQALSVCIKALDQVTTRHSYNDPTPDAVAIGRILDHLAARYGLQRDAEPQLHRLITQLTDALQPRPTGPQVAWQPVNTAGPYA